LATRGGEPDLALELDPDGKIVARQFLDLAHREPDELDDLGEEERLPYPVDLSHARPAPLCECPESRADDGTCGRCGRSLTRAVPHAV
jgi:hypothetical protein